MKNLFKFYINYFLALVFCILTSSAHAGPGNCSAVWDDFSNGFSAVNPEDKWFFFSAGPFIGNGGIANISKTNGVNVLHIEPTGINTSIKTSLYPHGTPAFTNYFAPEGVDNNPYKLPGGLDHVKWLAYMNHASVQGYPGFTAPPTGVVSCESRFRGRSYGTSPNPFLRSLISDPDDDLRLAGSAMNVIDFQTFMVFDMFVSNKKVYAFYERLPFGKGTPGFSPNYAAFSYAIPVGDIDPKYALNDYHQLHVSYNKSKGIVTWRLNGKKVFQVTKIGYRLENQPQPFTSTYTKLHPPKMLIDHGGIEEVTYPNQLDCGMGLFTLLDGHDGSNKGLVQLSNVPGLYNSITNIFEYTAFNLNNYLWGQGAVLDIKRFKVKSPDMCSSNGDRNNDDDDDDDDDDN